MDAYVKDSLNNELDERIRMLGLFHPVLARLNDPMWIQVIEKASIVQMPAGVTVFSNTIPCDTLNILLSGSIRVFQLGEDGREITLYRVCAGDLCFLSLSSLVANTPFGIIAKTETAISSLTIAQDDYEKLMTKSSVFRDYILMLASQRIFDLVQVVNDTTFLSLREKLAKHLLYRFEESSESEIKITHQDLACEFGVTRESINRVLREMEVSGYVKLMRGSIKIINQVALQDFR